MPVQLTISDETTAGNTLGEYVLDLLTERITVRELIRSRVYQEVQDYNLKQPEYFRGLVQPSDAEKALNGYKVPARRQLDWRKQFDAVLEAFEANRILILVNDRQMEDLDAEITVQPDTRVNFLKMVPLVGG